jgi:hypothetical protein
VASIIARKNPPIAATNGTRRLNILIPARTNNPRHKSISGVLRAERRHSRNLPTSKAISFRLLAINPDWGERSLDRATVNVYARLAGPGVTYLTSLWKLEYGAKLRTSFGVS